MNFKLQSEIFGDRLPPERIRDLLLIDLPEKRGSVQDVLHHFVRTVLPLCKNEASPRFLGFGDTGDDPSALVGDVLATFTQQNLINQSFDSPSATFVEIAVLRWLRTLLGLTNPAVETVRTVWDVGGVITHGGTMSNTVAMMIAREHQAPGTMMRGVEQPERFGVVVPCGIGRYSVKSALTWIGVGAQVIEVEASGFRYEPASLERVLRRHRGQVMAVVAYAGDSRTQTVDGLRTIHDAVRACDPGIWLHVDACWGLICAFSERLRHMIDGIAEFDSITVDPHKVMAVPYSMSALLVREPVSLRAVSSYSDLIMQEDYAFGQVTPFIGTKGWMSLKLWMMMLTHGREGLAELAERRIAKARRFAEMIDAHPRMLRVHDPDLAAVAFVYVPAVIEPTAPFSARDLDLINDVNRKVHDRILADGLWHLHQFSITDSLGRLRRGATVHPLRFMANNPRTEERHMADLIAYVETLGQTCERDTP